MKPDSHNWKRIKPKRKIIKPAYTLSRRHNEAQLTITGRETVDWSMFNLMPGFYQRETAYPYIDRHECWGPIIYDGEYGLSRIN